MAKKLRVFVYGTLKAGRSNHGALEGSVYLGRATIKGPFALVDLGWYPAVVKLPEGATVREIGGEVYEIDGDTLSTLDMIEGHPSYYQREKIMTSLGSKAWCYFLDESHANRPRIGDLFWSQTSNEAAWAEERNAAAA